MTQESPVFPKLTKQRKTICRVALILTVLFGAQSCTSLNNIFYWADTYLEWEIDKYFDLTNEQESFVEQRLDLFFLAFKNQEIPKYIDFLQEVKARSERNLAESDIEWLRNTLGQFNVNIAHLLADDVSAFLTSLEERQLLYFEKKLAESNKDWQEEHEKRSERTAEESLEKRYESIENWIGDLTQEQKQQLAILYQSAQSTSQFRFDRRIRSQQRFVSILKDNPDSSDLRGMLLDWYLNSDRHNTAAYTELSRKRHLRTVQLVLMLDQTATDNQRKFFINKLDDYIEQLEKILGG